jgi:NADH pyrophosphatase NudC (nudix superfamily)
MRFIHGVVAPKERLEAAWYFTYQGSRLLVQPESSHVTIPCLVDFAELGLPVLRQNYVGCLDGRHCYAVELPEGIAPPQGMTFEDLRRTYGRMDEDLFSVGLCRSSTGIGRISSVDVAELERKPIRPNEPKSARNVAPFIFPVLPPR